MILFMLKRFKFRLVWILLQVHIKCRIRRAVFWYLWNQCDAYDGSKFLSRANFIMCAWLSKFLGAGDYWLKSCDYKEMRLFNGGL